MNQPQFDFTAATILRDEKIAQAVEHADRVVDNWSESAFDALVDYAMRNEILTIENVRLASDWVPAAPSQRSWGAVAVRGVKKRIIAHHDYTQSKRADGHRMTLRVWRSLVFVP